MLEWDDETKLASKDELKSSAAKRDRASLLVVAGVNVGEMYPLEKPDTVIGRGHGVDIQILDEGMSRRHAIVRHRGDQMTVEDLGSRNGTFANGEQLFAPRVLRDGDKIQVGANTVLKFTWNDQLDETFQRQMYDSALRDALTKAYNKRYFLERLDTEVRFAARHRASLSLVLFDIDHFKKINDTHGHLAGDHVLAELSAHVAETIRAEDVFARYGGEEFAIICRAIDASGAAQFAERLRAHIASRRFIFQGVQIPVTVSLGVAGLAETQAAEPAALIGAADGALYAAKRAGRNRVGVA